MHTLWQDVKYGLRMLARNPGFAAVAILSLALGIGANTTIFTVVNAVLLNPLPVQDSSRLVELDTVDSKPRWVLRMPPNSACHTRTFAIIATRARPFLGFPSLHSTISP